MSVPATMSTSARQQQQQQKQAIEVERKFAIPAGVEASIEKLGGALLHRRSFRDVYYDTRSSHLYVGDAWLRRRDHAWELKCAPETEPGSGVAVVARRGVRGATQYAEYEREDEILHELRRFLPRDLDEIKRMGELDLFNDNDEEVDLDNANANQDNDCDLQNQPPQNVSSVAENQLNSALNLQTSQNGGVAEVAGRWKSLTLSELVAEYLVELAEYVTERRTYRLGDFLVVLDKADFGYELGEIEKVVYSAGEVAEARDGIDRVAEKLGIDLSGPRIPGKINVYLRQQNPKLFARLCSKLVKDGKMDA